MSTCKNECKNYKALVELYESVRLLVEASKAARNFIKNSSSVCGGTAISSLLSEIDYALDYADDALSDEYPDPIRDGWVDSMGRP